MWQKLKPFAIQHNSNKSVKINPQLFQEKIVCESYVEEYTDRIEKILRNNISAELVNLMDLCLFTVFIEMEAKQIYLKKYKY